MRGGYGLGWRCGGAAIARRLDGGPGLRRGPPIGALGARVVGAPATGRGRARFLDFGRRLYRRWAGGGAGATLARAGDELAEQFHRHDHFPPRGAAGRFAGPQAAHMQQYHADGDHSGGAQPAGLLESIVG